MTDLRSQLQSSLGDAYAIERELGGGGMSRVFLATERALNRRVVIKVLPGEAVSAISIERFKREIDLLARLQQANIVPVLAAGDLNGVLYITMPYVEGESLRSRLAVDRPLTVSAAIGILREVARALAYAHAQGVVHRDIKPDNVLVSGGSAMVTDFGVAKLVSVSTTAASGTLTATGLAIGTPAYMSPEQAAGDPAIDQRADIYAWGVMAYELLTGETPFAGRPAHAMLAAHASEAAKPISVRRPDVPADLALLVMRSLEKSPGKRPQTADEIVRTLDAVTTPSGMVTAGAARVRRATVWAGATMLLVLAGIWMATRPVTPATAVSIAALPLDVKAGSDSTITFFAGALVDRLRGELVRSGLLVASRSAAYAMKDRGVSPVDAARALHVTAILSGAVERLGTRVRVTLELTDTSGFAVWNRIVEKAAGDPMAVEDEIVRELSTALRERFSTAVNLAGRSHVPDPETFDLYSRGVFWYRKAGAEDLARSVEYFKKAIARDSLFADAFVGLAQSLIWYADAHAPPKDVIPSALAAAKRALELDERSSAAHSMMGEMLWGYSHDWEGARRELDRAIELDPNNAEPVLWKAWMALTLRDTATALRLVRSAMRLDPLDTFIAYMVPSLMEWIGPPDEALALHRQARESKVVPEGFYYLDAWESTALRRKGDLVAALAADSAATRALGYPTAGLVQTLAKMGRTDEAHRAVEALAAHARRTYFYPELLALAWLAVGEHDKALDELERGVASLSGGISYTLPAYPEFLVLKGNPRFERYLKTVKLDEYFK